MSRKPAGGVPADGSGAEADTHLGMPRRRRKAAEPDGQPATAGTGPGAGAPAGSGTPADGQDTHLGMPKRTRQASLAPQLRSDSWEPTEDEVKNDSGSDRSPEDLRARMAAMQSGWQRGRIVAEPATGPVAEQPAGRSSEVPVGPAVRSAKEEDTP